MRKDRAMVSRPAGVNGIAIGVVLVGGVLAYSGIKGVGVSAMIKSLVSGQLPAVSGDFNVTDVSGLTDTGGSTVVAAAQSQLGKPYVWDTPKNAADPNPKSFDCSGLTMWCYHKAGISLPHFTGAQYAKLSHRPFGQARPGDLVFFARGKVDIYHVGVYIGGGQIIEAPQAGIPVRVRGVNASTQGVMSNVGTFPGSDALNIPTPTTGAPGQQGGSSGANKAIGKMLASAYGWGAGAQWQALDSLWTRESGWNNQARNSSSGAYGIPQALPPSKMSAAAQGGNVSAQISWGLKYIKSRYGSPVAAWSHETSAGWY